MRRIKFNLSKKHTGWDAAVLLMEAYLSEPTKADQLLSQLPEAFTSERRTSCQSLFLGALRHGHRAKAAYKPMLRKRPRPLIEAILLVASYEFIFESQERHPKIVHHAVERSKRLTNRFEQGFLNAVLRKLPTALRSIKETSSPAHFYSHPDWLVDRWTKEFGETDTRSLLDWNQQIPVNHIKLYETPREIPDSLGTTQWQHFYQIGDSTQWNSEIEPLLNKGTAYIKDPSTRLAPELLAPKHGNEVLDLCAAPGGKAYDLAQIMRGQGRIVAVDLPGNRIDRLRKNLSTLQSRTLSCEIVESDVLALKPSDFSRRKLPTTYDCVMLDAPCSNTGVIQRRTDVKWRLREQDIASCASLQLELLTAAAAFVKSGGRLVYSTCSIESEENEEVVNHFLRSEAGTSFKKEAVATSLPWETGHDGAGAFLLVRD